MRFGRGRGVQFRRNGPRRPLPGGVAAVNPEDPAAPREVVLARHGGAAEAVHEPAIYGLDPRGDSARVHATTMNLRREDGKSWVDGTGAGVA